MRVVLAYLDPITGSALVQVALAAMAAIGLSYQYIRKGWRDLWSRLRPTTSKTEEPVSSPDI